MANDGWQDEDWKDEDEDKTAQTLALVDKKSPQVPQVIKPEPDYMKSDMRSAAQIGADQAHSGDYSGAAHTLIKGASGALAGPAAVLAGPVSAVTGAIGGTVGGIGGRKIAEHYGATPSQTDLAGDVGAGVGGTVGGLAGSKIGAPPDRAVSLGRGMLHDVANKYVGPRLANAILPEPYTAPNLDQVPLEQAPIGPKLPAAPGQTEAAPIKIAKGYTPPLLSKAPLEQAPIGPKIQSESEEPVSSRVGQSPLLESHSAPLTDNLVLTPEEARAQEHMQQIAAKRASERGTQYAGGMRPAGPNPKPGVWSARRGK